jgi:hypothetical protein
MKRPAVVRAALAGAGSYDLSRAAKGQRDRAIAVARPDELRSGRSPATGEDPSTGSSSRRVTGAISSGGRPVAVLAVVEQPQRASAFSKLGCGQ